MGDQTGCRSVNGSACSYRSVRRSGFERLTQRLLRESGFQQVTVTGKSGDGGIDGIGTLKVNPFVSFNMLFQCKRYQGAVTPWQVRDFRGAMQGRADKGVIITTGTFTLDAKKRPNGMEFLPLSLSMEIFLSKCSNSTNSAWFPNGRMKLMRCFSMNIRIDLKRVHGLAKNLSTEDVVLHKSHDYLRPFFRLHLRRINFYFRIQRRFVGIL